MKAGIAAALMLAIAIAGFAVGLVPALKAVAVFVPYCAAAIFLVGICWRVLAWANVPVPFRIPTTCGQQRSLPWIKQNRLDNPSSGLGAVGRMLLEVLLFRSLFRNSRADVRDNRVYFGEEKWLWLTAMGFHWSLLVILLRHLRLLVLPVPQFVLMLQKADGFFQVGTPEIYISDVVLFVCLCVLFTRRLTNPQVRYISLFTDYFALMLLGGIAVTGILMRYVTRIDTASAKQFALGLATFSPSVPETIDPMFFAHLFLICALAAYFPFSKLVHMGGVFLSPTRNLANNNRAVRHVNPWNYPVKTHTYPEWENEFRDKLEAAEIPLEADYAHDTRAN